MDFYFLCTVLLVVVSLFIIAIIWYHYILDTNNIKVENNELKKLSIKNRTCYYFDDIIKFEYFDFDNK